MKDSFPLRQKQNKGIYYGHYRFVLAVLFSTTRQEKEIDDILTQKKEFTDHYFCLENLGINLIRKCKVNKKKAKIRLINKSEQLTK